MAPTAVPSSDPFSDPVHTSEDHEYAEGSTLHVGRDASLTLATDSLIVLAERKPTQVIPFFNVLWAELSDFDIVIQYAKPTSKNVVRVAIVNYLVEKPQQGYAEDWVSKLLDRAYGESQRKKRIKVLINPFGGRGKSQKWFLRDIEPIFAAARCSLDVERTLYQGHAVEIAEKLDTEAYDVVASCSGDGLPHEVFNGLGKKQDATKALAKVAVVQLPCGTGNAMSLNLNGTDSTSLAALCIVKGIRTPLDLVSITQGDRRTLSFLSQSVGIVADCDLGTEHIRWMGSARFTYGFLIRIMRKTVYPADLAVKIDIPSKAAINEHYRKELTNHAPAEQRRDSHETKEGGLPELQYGSISSPLPSDFIDVPSSKLGNFYAGNMPFMAPAANFFPAALPSDDRLDLVTVDGDISRTSAIKLLLAVENGKFYGNSNVNYRKISGYRITPRGQKNGYISIDGERVPFEGFQAEVHRGLGTVLSRSGHLYEAEGVVPRPGQGA
ncbi:sphingosine kinase, partial [Lecanoromycetidae sp. Uapishka_2]